MDEIVLKYNKDSDTVCYYTLTPKLRYAKKHIPIDEQSARYELRLQQMWQGNDGSVEWRWVDVVE